MTPPLGLLNRQYIVFNLALKKDGEIVVTGSSILFVFQQPF